MESKYTSLELSKKLAEGGCRLDYEKHYLGTGIRTYDILNDICCKYAKEFFGEEIVCGICGSKNIRTTLISRTSQCSTKCLDCICDVIYSIDYKYHPKQILELMQQGKKQEAEDYIWEHCVFNKKEVSDV